MYQINEFCRTNKIGFIQAQSLGAMGYTFVDYGENFKINDANGEETQSFIVVNVTQANPAIVTVHEGKRHNFQNGDYVLFKEIKGMT